MEKKSKVVSKRLRKQLDELERSKRYDEATHEAMLMHNTRWENCFTIKWYMKRKQ